MRTFLKRLLTLLAVLFYLSGSFAYAEGDKLLEVFVLKTEKAVSGNLGSGPQFNWANVALELPTDDEMKVARKAVENSGFKPEDLKSVGQEIPLEFFVLVVKKAKTEKPATEKEKVNGIAVVKPTEEELGEAMVSYKNYQEAMVFLSHMDLQFGFGGAPNLSEGLSHSYHTGNNGFVGLGYNFFPNFEMLLNFEFTNFISSNDSRTHGLDMDELTFELLAKYRFSDHGIRPYLFAGPAGSESSFRGSFKYESFQGSVGYTNTGDFSLVGGLGLEIPLGRGHIFVQSELIYTWPSTDTVNFAQLDGQMVFLPIQIGLSFGK